MTSDLAPQMITIDSLVFGGDAFGRIDGKATFIPYGAPGDVVRIQIEREKRSYQHGTIVEILEAGPGRRTANCVYYERCGGCQWQHLVYRDQVAAKETILRDVLTRIGVDPQAIEPLRKSTEEFHYRRRTRLSWRVDPNGHVHLGYYQRASKQMIDIASCPLLMDPLNRALALCRKHLATLPQTQGSLFLLADREQHVVVSVRVQGSVPDRYDWNSWLDDPIIGMVVDGEDATLVLGERDVFLGEKVPYRASATAFSQTHAALELELRDVVAAWRKQVAPHGRILELFSGIGTFTTALVSPNDSIDHFAVEVSAEAVAQFEHNLAGTSWRVIQTNAIDAVRQFIEEKQHFDLIVLDPPREGCYDVVTRIAELRPKHIIYISCDPMTLTRDLKALIQAQFRVVQAIGFDMMPQTFHIEAAVLLELENQ